MIKTLRIQTVENDNVMGKGICSTEDQCNVISGRVRIFTPGAGLADIFFPGTYTYYIIIKVFIFQYITFEH